MRLGVSVLYSMVGRVGTLGYGRSTVGEKAMGEAGVSIPVVGRVVVGNASKVEGSRPVDDMKHGKR